MAHRSLKDIKAWSTFLSCFYRKQAPTRWKVLTANMETPDQLKPEGWWCPKLHLHANQTETWAQANAAPCSPSLTLCLEPFSWKPSESANFLSMIYQLSLFGTLQLKQQQQHCSSLHRKPKSVDWSYCMQVSRLKFGSVTVQSLQAIVPPRAAHLQISFDI